MKKLLINEVGKDVHFYDVYGMNQKWRSKTTYSYISKPRPNHGFMYVLCDKVVVTPKSGEQHTFNFGDIFYIPKGLYYTVQFYGTNGKYDNLLINFLMEDRENGELCFSDKVMKMVGSASARYTDDFYTIINHYMGTANNSFAIMSAFYSLLNNFAKHLEKRILTSNEYNMIAPAIIYMDSHINENTSVPELSKMCLLSETCFRKYFKKYTGVSPSEYKINAKIKKAIQMLETEDINATEIAFELGFYDVSYFYKIFKKMTGVTPAEYMQNNKNE